MYAALQRPELSDRFSRPSPPDRDTRRAPEASQPSIDLQTMIERLAVRSGAAGLQVSFHEYSGEARVIAASRSVYEDLPALTEAAIEHCRGDRFRLTAAERTAEQTIACRSTMFDGGLVVATFWQPRGFDEHFDSVDEDTNDLFAYLRLWLSHHRERCHARQLSATLDGFGFGVLLLDGAGRLIFANAAGASILDRQAGLRRAGGSVTAIGMADAVRLSTILNHITSRAVAGNGADLQATLRLGDTSTSNSLIVTIVPLVRPEDVDDAPAAALYVVDSSVDLEPMLRCACGVFRLSPAETRLAIHVVNGSTLTEAARALHIKEATARSCLKQIFIKTETRRQADLVRALVCSLVQARQPGAGALARAPRFGPDAPFSVSF